MRGCINAGVETTLGSDAGVSMVGILISRDVDWGRSEYEGTIGFSIVNGGKII